MLCVVNIKMFDKLLIILIKLARIDWLKCNISLIYNLHTVISKTIAGTKYVQFKCVILLKGKFMR